MIEECLKCVDLCIILNQQHHDHDDGHLGDVKDDGEEEGGQDVDGQVYGGGVTPLKIKLNKIYICLIRFEFAE